MSDESKDGSISEPIEAISCTKVAETICAVSVLLSFPHNNNIGIRLKTVINGDEHCWDMQTHSLHDSWISRDVD